MLDNWDNLAPYQPLEAGNVWYVRRPEGSGEELASLVRGFNPIAVAGTMGSGKSTELAAAASKVPLGILVQLDRFLDMRRLTEDEVYTAIAKAMFTTLRDNASNEEIIASSLAAAPPSEIRSRDLLLMALRTKSEQNSGARITLLIDGLEKCPDERSRSLAQQLLGLSNEANIVIVVPPSLVTGPPAYELTSTVEKVFAVRPILVEGEPEAQARAGRAFLREMVLRRLGETAPSEDLSLLLDRAARMSGGVPRVMLKLVYDAKRYAMLGERELPTMQDLGEAAKDRAEHLERLLAPDDLEAIRAADGTSGSEMAPVDRRLRLLVHGLLLEYKVGDRVIVHPAPLLPGAFARKDAA